MYLHPPPERTDGPFSLALSAACSARSGAPAAAAAVGQRQAGLLREEPQLDLVVYVRRLAALITTEPTLPEVLYIG